MGLRPANTGKRYPGFDSSFFPERNLWQGNACHTRLFFRVINFGIVVVVLMLQEDNVFLRVIIKSVLFAGLTFSLNF